METRTIVPVILGVLIIAVAAFGLYYTGTMEKDQSLSCDRTDLVGAFVKNSRGEVIGFVSRIEDFADQSFAIINHGSESSYGEGGRYTPVPVGALKIPEPGMVQPTNRRPWSSTGRRGLLKLRPTGIRPRWTIQSMKPESPGFSGFNRFFAAEP